MEIREAQYRQGRLRYRHGLKIILKRLYQEDKGINIPLDDPGGTQRGQRIEETQVLQGAYYQANYVPEEGSNVGGRCDI